MAAVLGISAYYHDAAAALVVDGRIVAAMQEERFSRLKNDPALPRRAAFACLALGGPSARRSRRGGVLREPVREARAGRRLAGPRLTRAPCASSRRRWAASSASKLWVLDQIADTLGIERRKVRFVEHHESHAASAFLTSRYADAAVLTVDGVGEQATTALWHGEGSSLRCLGAIDFPHSLGLLYAAFTAYLGFEVNEGEYKVMGLAAYGAPRFRDELGQVLHVDADGSFRLEPRFFAHTTDRDLGFSPALEALLGPRRPPGRRFELAASADDQRCADVAASLQLVTEEALLGLARAARARTGSTALCLAGGVAPQRARQRAPGPRGRLRAGVRAARGGRRRRRAGAALIGARDLGDPRPPPLVTAALGEPFDGGAAIDLARALGFSPRTRPRSRRPPSPPTSPPAGWSRCAAGGSSGGHARSASVRCWRTPPPRAAASG